MDEERELYALSTEELAKQCVLETQHYLLHGHAQATSSCYELFRRAVVAQDQTAAAELYHCYAEVVGRWVRKRLRFDYTTGDVDACVNWAFASMFRSLSRPGAFDQFSGLERLLSYLRSCAYSAAETENRALHARETELVDHLSTGDDDLLDALLQVTQAETVRRLVDSLLKDERERTVYEAYFTLDIPPRMIYETYPRLFRDVQDVHRVKQIMLERIGRKLHKARQELGI